MLLVELHSSETRTSSGIFFQSRGAWLGCAAGIVVLCILKEKRFLWQLPLLLIAFLVVLYWRADGQVQELQRPVPAVHALVPELRGAERVKPFPALLFSVFEGSVRTMTEMLYMKDVDSNYIREFDAKVLDTLDLESLLFTCEQLTDRLLDSAKKAV